MHTKRKFLYLFLFLFILTSGVYAAYAWNPVPVDQDPLVHMPGTQPNQVSLESPTRCLNCHAGYNSEVEPGFNWQGSMMAQAARDFLFWSCMTVSAQDSIWAAGRPNATDICERCHFPKGWLEGRSDPTNASLMTGADFDGVAISDDGVNWHPIWSAVGQSAGVWQEYSFDLVAEAAAAEVPAEEEAQEEPKKD